MKSKVKKRIIFKIDKLEDESLARVVVEGLKRTIKELRKEGKIQNGTEVVFKFASGDMYSFVERESKLTK